jgi:sugar phosphate permease
MIAYILRVNISVAIVSMTDEEQSKAINQDVRKRACGDWRLLRNRFIIAQPWNIFEFFFPQIPVYKWNEAQKSAILSSFFWGYILLPIWFGNLAEKYGSKLILSVGMIASSVLTVTVPFSAQYGYITVCVFRFLQGIAQVINKRWITRISVLD